MRILSSHAGYEPAPEGYLALGSGPESGEVG